jgi:hypothetical protein
VLIGQKKALGIAVRNDRPQRRYSGLLNSLRSDRRIYWVGLIWPKPSTSGGTGKYPRKEMPPHELLGLRQLGPEWSRYPTRVI